MKIYIDFSKQAITKTDSDVAYVGDVYSNVFELLFFNYGDATDWFPTMSQLAPNGREAGDFSADALGENETYNYVEDGVTYKRYKFTIGDGWVRMKGRSNFFIWVNKLVDSSASLQRKCYGKLNVALNESTDNYFIQDPYFNPKIKKYINDKIDALNGLEPSGVATSTTILAFTTNKGIYVATDNGHWYYWNGTQYADGGIFISSIDNTKVNNLENNFKNIFSESPNILDVNNITIIKGYFLNTGNGNLNTNSAYMTTNDYIPVKPNTTYYCNSWTKSDNTHYSFSPIVCFYDINKNFIPTGLQSDTFTTPSNCYYIRFSTLTSVYNARLITISANSILNNYIPYYKMLKKDLIIEKIVIKVGSSNTNDYKKLRRCLDSITDSSINKQYIIELEEGTYDLSTEITPEEIADDNFKGVFIPDYVTIIGADRDKTIITLTLQNQNQNISTLNLRNTSGIENVTIIGNNTRYVIHDDFASNSNDSYYRVLKNVKIIGNTNYLNTCYGCGEHSGMIAKFENCIFDGTNVNPNSGLGIPFLIHNNVEWKNACYFTFVNCRFLTTKNLPDNPAAARGGLLLRTLKHAYNDTSRIANLFSYITLKGCNVNGIVLKEENATYYGSGCLFKVDGYYNIEDEYRNYNTDGIDYSSYIDLI